MRQLGKLYVFEGPDGVGKSELSSRFTAMLNEKGTPAKLLSFPGKNEGTIGKLVYDLHHAPQSFGVARMSSSSLQLMHIAAHIDAIETVILPALRAGTSSFWTDSGGPPRCMDSPGGSDKRLLESMINVELAAWGAIRPCVVFLVQRKSTSASRARIAMAAMERTL